MTVSTEETITRRGINTSQASEKLSVVVVSNSEQQQMVYAVRAAVFLGKPGWDYRHTFDGNDFCSTHILGFIGDEPAGTVRVRWFAQFARIERIAIRPEYRSLKLLNLLATTSLRLCRRKGYDLIAGLAYPELVRFWGRHGAKPSGSMLKSEYGDVIPIMGVPKNWPDIEPLTIDSAGQPGFEWGAFGWEGDRI